MTIPQPQKDEQGKIVGDFYPLQRAEILALRKNKLINNAAYVHLALRFENPFCDRPIEILPKEFALRWSIPESSVYEAIAKLKEAGAIEIKYGKVIIQWVNSQEDETIHSQQDGFSGNSESAQPTRIDSGFSETSLDSQKEFRNPRIDSEISEKDIYKDRVRPQTSSDYSDFLNSLSDSSERESFKNYCEKRASQEAKNPKAWIKKAWKDLWNDFQEQEAKKKEVEEQIQASKEQLTEKAPKNAARLNESWQIANQRKSVVAKKAIEEQAISLGYVVRPNEGIFDPSEDPSEGDFSGGAGGGE